MLFNSPSRRLSPLFHEEGQNLNYLFMRSTDVFQRGVREKRGLGA
jgi:hypothetical protein